MSASQISLELALRLKVWVNVEKTDVVGPENSNNHEAADPCDYDSRSRSLDDYFEKLSNSTSVGEYCLYTLKSLLVCPFIKLPGAFEHERNAEG